MHHRGLWLSHESCCHMSRATQARAQPHVMFLPQLHGVTTSHSVSQCHNMTTSVSQTGKHRQLVSMTFEIYTIVYFCNYLNVIAMSQGRIENFADICMLWP